MITFAGNTFGSARPLARIYRARLENCFLDGCDDVSGLDQETPGAAKTVYLLPRAALDVAVRFWAQINIYTQMRSMSVAI
jgi:hypothetical protein